MHHFHRLVSFWSSLLSRNGGRTSLGSSGSSYLLPPSKSNENGTEGEEEEKNFLEFSFFVLNSGAKETNEGKQRGWRGTHLEYCRYFPLSLNLLEFSTSVFVRHIWENRATWISFAVRVVSNRPFLVRRR